MTEQLNLCSSLGRRFLYEQCWLKDPEEIKSELSKLTLMLGIFREPVGKALCGKLGEKLMQLRDIRGTVKRTGESCTLDDLELFEIKYFALLAEEIRELTGEWDFIRLPDLQEVVDLLDPEGNRIPHFYIYDAYSEELAGLRKQMRIRKSQGADEAATEELFCQGELIEDRIREELSAQLREYHLVLEQALQTVAGLDVLLAKAEQAARMNLICAELVEDKEGEVSFEGLFNPQLEGLLRQEGKVFQPVDIRLLPEATVITGANMAGKTVLLKSIALAQYLLQFGFFVPARFARMAVVDEVLMSIGDEQDELSGLSSFAAEMLRINKMIARIHRGDRILVLIDELARTTNPLEGGAIVNGVVDFLTTHHTLALVTTHYSGIVAQCRRLRVKGFVEKRVQGELTLDNMNNFIDYSLEEDHQGEVPREALRIAWMLGVDKELLGCAEYYLAGAGKDQEQTVQ